jgi:hypothetical protein
MNAKRCITHGLALCGGFFVAFALSQKGTTQREVVPQEKKLGSFSRNAAVRPANISARELLKSLASVPMESQERSNFKYEIYQEWAKKDPLGFLDYIEHRPLGYYLNSDDPFLILAKTQPEELLAYAKRTGCKAAVRVLVENADPSTVLALWQLNGGGGIPMDLLQTLARRGEDLDPHFHEKLAAISDQAARKVTLAEAASRMVDAGRTEDFFAFIRQYPEALVPEEIGRGAGHLMLMDPRELSRLAALEVEVQKAAVGEIIDSFHDDRVSEQGQREILATLATRGLLDSRRKEVFEMLMDVGDNSNESVVAWRDWAVSLPGSEETRPLQLASIVRWSLSTKAEAADFVALPVGPLRDGAAVGGVGRYLEEENLLEARKMIDLIGDSKLREKVEDYLTLVEKGEEPENFDPFGFDEK